MLRASLIAMLAVAAAVTCRSDYPQVRAYFLERGISHCISGNCMQGNGKEDIGNGLVYEGHFENYVPDGDGLLYENGNLVYSGKWDSGFPAQEDATLASQSEGTQAPVTGKLGPKVKDYGDQKGINTAIVILSVIQAASGGPSIRAPRGVPHEPRIPEQ